MKRQREATATLFSHFPEWEQTWIADGVGFDKVPDDCLQGCSGTYSCECPKCRDCEPATVGSEKCCSETPRITYMLDAAAYAGYAEGARDKLELMVLGAMFGFACGMIVTTLFFRFHQ